MEGGIVVNAPGCFSCTPINRNILAAKRAGRRSEADRACYLDNTDLSNPSHQDVATTTPSQISDCLINTNLSFKLEFLAGRFPPNGDPTQPEAKKIYWRITEAWPPTVRHLSRCHFNGKCADIAIDLTKGLGSTDMCAAANALMGELQSTGLQRVEGGAQATSLNFFINEYTTCGGTKFDTSNAPHIHVVIGGE